MNVGERHASGAHHALSTFITSPKNTRIIVHLVHGHVVPRRRHSFSALRSVSHAFFAEVVTISKLRPTAFRVIARATVRACTGPDLVTGPIFTSSLRQVSRSRTMASWAPAMFGDTLVSKDGTEHDTKTSLAGKTVGIYFSAHWCPPCRQFTPVFAETYAKLVGAGKPFQVVFVSSDRDEPSFDEYRGEMPWLAMPYAQHTSKETLSKKFKVNGIPSLVVVDEHGEVITSDGRNAVVRTPEKFPWRPPSLAEVLGDSFTRNGQDGSESTEVTLASVQSQKKNIGVYFSAHWCGPCRQFTPQLKTLYETLTAKGEAFEIIFVSSDRTEDEFVEYVSESMPAWLTVPFEDQARRTALSEHFNVQGIPHFVMLNHDLKVINNAARGSVLGDPTGAKFPWAPPLVVDVDSEDMDGGINDTPTVVLLMEECGELWDALRDAMEGVAKKTRQKELESGIENRQVLFTTVTESGGGVGGQLRKLAKLGKAYHNKPQMVLLDLANGGYVPFPGEITSESIETLVNDFAAGKLALTKA